jgi:hypothetical protein
MYPGSRPSPEISAETAQAVRSVYNLQHVYVRIGDELPSVQETINVSALDSTSLSDADAVFRLALVTAFQYAEDLPDSSAAIASTKRLDWKYALHLPIRHPGVSPKSLCMFRRNLYPQHRGLEEYSRFLNRLHTLGLFTRPLSNGAPDPAETLITVCMITRLQNLKLRMKAAMSAIIVEASDWMRTNALPYWYRRYSTSALSYPTHPSTAALTEEALVVGGDIARLLSMVPGINEIGLESQAEILGLKKVWEDEFAVNGNTIQWRVPGCASCVCNHLGDLDR